MSARQARALQVWLRNACGRPTHRNIPLYCGANYANSFPRALVAQLVEHLICNQGVGGSNPSGGTSKIKQLAKNAILPESNFIADF